MLGFVVPRIHVLKNNDKVMLLNRDNVKKTVLSVQQYKSLLQIIHADNLKPGKYAVEDNDPDLNTVFTALVKGFFYSDHYKPVVKPLSSYMKENLKMVYLFMTEKCNMHCIYCYKDSEQISSGSQYSSIDVNKVKRLIDTFADMKIKELAFTGGEPLLVREIFELGEYAASKGLYTCLLTNGTLVTPENAPRMKCFNAVKISLDSVIPEINEITRGKGVTERIKRGIRLAKMNENRVVIECVVNARNYDTIERTIRELYRELCVDEIRFTYMEPIGRGKDNPLLMDRPYGETQEHIVKAHWDVVGGKLSKFLQGMLPVDSKCMIGCGAGINEIIVECDGSTYPCRIFQDPAYCMGNLLEESLCDMQQKESFIALRENLSVDRIKGCCDCTYKYLCGGGCRPAHKGFTDDYLINHKDWCDMTCKNLEFILWLQEGIDPFTGEYLYQTESGTL